MARWRTIARVWMDNTMAQALIIRINTHLIHLVHLKHMSHLFQWRVAGQQLKANQRFAKFNAERENYTKTRQTFVGLRQK